MVNRDFIFLDYNSTTPVDERVLDKMLPYFNLSFANPSSTHYFGLTINEEIKQAREQIAELINAEAKEIVFTSGATESINIAFKGVSENYIHRGKHIITVITEHKAILDACKELEQKGFEITYLSVQKDGLINLEELKKSLRSDTILVSVMYVNNETGVIQPIQEISKLTHEVGAIFMSDCTQAFGKIEIDIDDLGIDLMCFSGHKIYGPKGIGALYFRQNGTKIKLSKFNQGSQEDGLRSGTLNVPGIIGLVEAAKLTYSELDEDKRRIENLRNKLESELLKLPKTFLNGAIQERVFNTTNICFQGQDANMLIGRMKNMAVSNGSACTSAIVEPSHVLKAIGLSDDDAFASLRISLGKYTTENEIQQFAETIKKYIE
jgi:cysteine desulfurase